MKYLLVVILLFISCDSSKLEETTMDKFIGTWELTGRSIFKNMNIKIVKLEEDTFIGKFISLNENKYVKMFVDSNETWVTSIKRLSNYEFEISERKLAADLFSLYGHSSIKTFNAQFLSDDQIVLYSKESNPKGSNLIYKRVK
jgi:hypothetical protein